MLRYVWNGKVVQAMDEETLRSGVDTAGGAIRRTVLGWQDRLHKAFLPSPKDVTDDYWEWLQWRLTQRFFSSTMQNLSTQSMLMALGLGAKKSIAAGAAINWLLKDGVGRIARMTVATNFCQSFDSDLKRIRYVTSLVFEATIGCEFLTPFFPQHFLALASVANVGKAIALSAFVAVQPAFQKAMCSGGNLADLAAKNQAQHMVVDMLALAVSAAFMYTVRNSERARMVVPLLAFPLLAAADIWSVYHEIKAIQLKVLNRERAEMVADRWLAEGARHMPTAAQISADERLLLPQDICGGFMPLAITSVDQLVRSPSDLPPLRPYDRELYLMAMQLPVDHASTSSAQPASINGQSAAAAARGGGFRAPWAPPPQPQLCMCLNEDATSADIFKAVLEATHLRRALRAQLEAKLGRQLPEAVRDGGAVVRAGGGGTGAAAGASPPPPPLRGAQLWAAAGPLMTQAELDRFAHDARAKAAANLPRFLEQLHESGWKTKTFLLSTSEKQRYVCVGGSKKER
ncbi:hypothetical protein FOA52_002536 [Chlamydomonas sp. UWO 241]|nr:hypothetical protein FOA52_002536 [Chlamydomonas sp. UWO 241]